MRQEGPGCIVVGVYWRATPGAEITGSGLLLVVRQGGSNRLVDWEEWSATARAGSYL